MYIIRLVIKFILLHTFKYFSRAMSYNYSNLIEVEKIHAYKFLTFNRGSPTKKNKKVAG